MVVLAQEEARLLNHNYIGTEHLLLGLLSEGEGVAARALAALNVTPEAARAQVKSMVSGGTEAPPAGYIPFTPRAKKALELSLRNALGLGHSFIGTEHILLGLVQEGSEAGAGVAVGVLHALGAEPDAIRQEVMAQISVPGPGGAWSTNVAFYPSYPLPPGTSFSFNYLAAWLTLVEIDVPTLAQQTPGFPQFLFAGANRPSDLRDQQQNTFRDLRQASLSLSNNLTWIAGTHSLKMGGIYTRNYAKDGYSTGANESKGRYNFTGWATGNAFGFVVFGPSEGRIGERVT